MTDLIQKLDNDYLLGCIKYRDVYFLYALPLGWWILNYSKYDPSIGSHENAANFRNGVFNVRDSEIGNFVTAIENDKVTPDDLKTVSSATTESLRVKFFVDFDEKLFINGYYENVEPEEYLPDASWRGEMGTPIDFLPKNFVNEYEGLS